MTPDVELLVAHADQTCCTYSRLRTLASESLIVLAHLLGSMHAAGTALLLASSLGSCISNAYHAGGLHCELKIKIPANTACQYSKPLGMQAMLSSRSQHILKLSLCSSDKKTTAIT